MKYSKEPAEIRQQRFDFINKRWLQLNTLEKEWGDKALRYLMLSNAGGAVAVLSFMGASESIRKMVGPRLALSSFLLGIVIFGVLVAQQFHHFRSLYHNWMSDSEKYLQDEMEWITLIDRDDKRYSQKRLNTFLPIRHSYCSF